ncbi:MAG TPA: DMT family transporter [Burkholderiales bacterium]|nr:DMT family transporter [Burkholderiales bacterium]
MNAERKPLDATAVSVMVLLCLVWGVGHVAAKFAAQGISLVFQSGVRSVIATGLLLAWGAVRGIPLWERDRTFWPGLVAGLLFAAEFVFIFAGLKTTDAARMVVFVYLAPCMTALGLHFFIPQERLVMRQWAGILIAFAGVAVAFGDGFASGRGTLLGDFFGILGAAFWAATTVLIRATRLAGVSAAKTLFYQLAVSGPVLLLVSWLMGEPGVIRLTPVVAAAFAYQCAVVAFASFLTWFWLLRHYLAARLSVFTFLTPFFGVLGGVVLLGEPLTPSFAAAAALVGAGIYLVNSKT